MIRKEVDFFGAKLLKLRQEKERREIGRRLLIDEENKQREDALIIQKTMEGRRVQARLLVVKNGNEILLPKLLKVQEVFLVGQNSELYNNEHSYLMSDDDKSWYVIGLRWGGHKVYDSGSKHSYTFYENRVVLDINEKEKVAVVFPKGSSVITSLAKRNWEKIVSNTIVNGIRTGKCLMATKGVDHNNAIYPDCF